MSLVQVGLIETNVTGYFLSAVSLAVVVALIGKYFCKEAAGSGLPEFKSILSSDLKMAERQHLVSSRIFVAKVVGLILGTLYIIYCIKYILHYNVYYLM